MAQNQNKALNPIRMDSRKFLGALNDSAQAKVAFFESKVRELGKAVNKNWKLAALYSKDLYIEDVDANAFYLAKHQRTHGAINITDIRPISIIESQKAGLFEESCLRLVNAIEKNDQKGMQSSFSRMKAQRFTGRIIPESGMVKSKDGIIRKIKVQTPAQLNESIKKRIVSCIAESISNRVIIEDNHVVGGHFVDGGKFSLPVSKWATKKLTAKSMRKVAMEAYLSPGFQNRMYDVASLVTEGKIDKAVGIVAPFLEEYEEFTLLNRSQVKNLVSNALAARAIFNPQLCEDVSTLFHKTNLRVNRSKIIKEWKNIASAVENYNLAQNVSVLSEAKDFEPVYNKFLDLIFETIGNREIAAEALATTLSQLRDKTPRIMENHELKSKLDGLINKLKDKSVDDATIYEAEDLIATIQEEVTSNENLSDFDQMPNTSDSGLPEVSEEEDTVGGSGAPVININSPLIQIGGKSSAAGEAGEAEDDLGLGEPAGEDDLSALLNEPPAAETPGAPGAPATPAAPAAPGAAPAAPGAAPPAPGAAPAAPPRLESRRRSGKDIIESNDTYAYKTSRGNRNLMGQYGKNAIADEDKIRTIVKMVDRHVITNNLRNEDLLRRLPAIAESCIKKIILNLNQEMLPLAVNQIVDTYQSLRKITVSESQYHFPKTAKRGMRKTSRGKGKSGPKDIKENKVIWTARDGDVLYGTLSGIKFALDHGNAELPAVLMSEDGTVEIPVPQKVQNSALAAANVIKGNPKLFHEWLSGSIHQLAPISESEFDTLREEFEEEVDSMKPVESTEPTVESPSEEEAVPDFSKVDDEAGVDMGDVDSDIEVDSDMDDTDDMGDMDGLEGGDDAGEPGLEGEDGIDDDIGDEMAGIEPTDDVDIDLGSEGEDFDDEGHSDHGLQVEIDEIRSEIDEIKDHVGMDDDEVDVEDEMDMEASDIEDEELETADDLESEDADMDEGMEMEDDMSDDMDMDMNEVSDIDGGIGDSEEEEIDADNSDIGDEDTSDDDYDAEDESDDETDVEIEDEDEDFDGLNEDNDITDPSKSKYHSQAEEDPRTDVKHKVNKRKDDESIEGIGDRDDLDSIDL